MVVQPTRADRKRARAIRARLRREHRRPLALRARELLGEGMTPEEVASTLAPVIDALVPLGALGPIGVVAEIVDGPIAWVVVLIVAREVARATRARRAQAKPATSAG